jgi:prepilin-type N-terminal cleavage/methylation domain-containing protein
MMGRTSTKLGEERGFTLLELLVVLLVVGILLLIAVASFRPASASAAAASCKHNQHVFDEACAMYTSMNGGTAPVTLEQVRTYVKDFDKIVTCPTDNTTLTYDTATGSCSCPNHP